MTLEEIKLRRLAGQHLTRPADSLAVAADVCGLQAQFLGAACHGLRIRGGSGTAGLVKTWTLRGTMHLIPANDLPLYLPRCGTAEDVCDSPWYRWLCEHGHPLSPARARHFALLIVDGIAHGTAEREALRALCRDDGMTAEEEAHVFHSWGGTIAELAQAGVVCFEVCQKKIYRLCPPFAPLAPEEAQIALARRYFTHFGPATLRDASAFFGVPQRQVKAWLARLPVEAFICQGREYFHLPLAGDVPVMPRCLFLAGFDQLMMGYRKEDNPFLPAEHVRRVFSRAGIIFPPLLVDGRVVGLWKQEAGCIRCTALEELAPQARRHVEWEAAALWPEKRLVWGESDLDA